MSGPDDVVELTPNALRGKLVNIALDLPEFREALDEAAREIRSVALQGVNEATIEGHFERVVYRLLYDIGLKFSPEKEARVSRRHTFCGRADSRLGSLVIEYKRPSLLDSEASRKAATEQLSGYLASLSKKSKAPLEGILTNGLVIIEIRACSGIVSEPGPALPLDGPALRRLTQKIISLALSSLTAENLIRDFCRSKTDGILFRVARLLNSVLEASSVKKTQMLQAEWEQLFRISHEDTSRQPRIAARRKVLSEIFDCPVEQSKDEYRTLFALHTSYAILLKLIAFHVVSDVYLGKIPQDFQQLVNATSGSLRIFCDGLEDGAIFRKLGILNLLEGDFFSWYCDKNQWTDDIADAVRTVVSVLARYEEARNIFQSRESEDLFRELYHAAVPQTIRNSFGEVYTPKWLAEHVIESAKPESNWRLLDPCCGSGTFIVAAISRLKRESDSAGTDLGKNVLSRVAGIDLHPLAVLTARVNYFIHISDLLKNYHEEIVIPVYLGDASNSPDLEKIDDVECLRYELQTLVKPIPCVLPVSVIRTGRFITLMREYEAAVRDKDAGKALKTLLNEIPKPDKKDSIIKALNTFTDELVELEIKNWNGIWARILSNFLTTACLGKFDVIAGNPPWIDWKNLPEGYRNRIKSFCIERGLFSGAGLTGGINLNMCALVAYISIKNWLAEQGRLAFLMPRELAYQASYDGWRNLGDNEWRFLAFHDWTRAGYPFDPIKEDFMTFVIGRDEHATSSVPVMKYIAARGKRAANWQDLEEAMSELKSESMIAQQITPGKNAFTITQGMEELNNFSLVAGNCDYIGRDGIQFYPQELLLLKHQGEGPEKGTVWLQNIQLKRAQRPVPSQKILLETKYLYPVVRASTIEAFRHAYDQILVPFPHEATNPRLAIPVEKLKKTSKLLYGYYRDNRELLENLSAGNARVRSANQDEFYSLARVGRYSFAPIHVVFRKDTKWCAVVVSSQATPWGEKKMLLCQSHAASMCERKNGDFITEDEAHYICSVLNAPIVAGFIYASSDNRSFKVRPPVYLPVYSDHDENHKALVRLSREAHANPDKIDSISKDIDHYYLKLCRDKTTSDLKPII